MKIHCCVLKRLNKFIFVDNNRTLEIKDAVYTRDTGAYKCKARNSAGVGQDIATVFIENSHVPTYQSGEEGLQGEHPVLYPRTPNQYKSSKMSFHFVCSFDTKF